MINSNFHNTRLLLKLYPQINWRIKTELDEINEEKSQYNIKDVEVFINILETTDLIESKILENLTDMTFSIMVLKVMENSFELMKKHPDNGEKLYDILYECFLLRPKMTDEQVVAKLDLSRSTFYRLKKKCVELLDTILWGYEIPRIIDALSTN